MKIGFKKLLEDRLPEGKDRDYLLYRLEREKMYEIKSKLRRNRRLKENGTD